MAFQLPSKTEVENGTHHFLSRSWDLVVASPGVPSALLASARARGIPVWGELELGYRVLLPSGRWPAWSAAITGTNGKTTTTALLGAIFKASGRPTVVAGNIGVPLCAVVNGVTPPPPLFWKCRVISWKRGSVSPVRGAVLNVTPDHLARHKTLAAYAAAKFRMFQSQGVGDSAVLNAEDPWCRRLAPLVPGKIPLVRRSNLPSVGGAQKSSRPTQLGKRPRGRGLCPRPGCSTARHCQALATFRGVEHRLELVRTWRGVRFINDSKATNVDSTRVALESFSKPLIVILGGQDKGAPYRPLVPLLRKKAKAVLLIGEAAGKIERDLFGQVPLVRCETLARAVDHAARTARPGDVVLLSPGVRFFRPIQQL
jgi:UDP-N-acetylmuramoylalanine--D-glutamate ligase